MATGYNVVDLKVASGRGITVTNVPIYGTASVAQMVFAHVLHLTQRVAEHSQAVHAGRWSSAKDWSFWDFPQVELAGLTMGIVGLGRIGRATAKLADALGMKIVATSRTVANLPDYIQRVDINTVVDNVAAFLAGRPQNVVN